MNWIFGYLSSTPEIEIAFTVTLGRVSVYEFEPEIDEQVFPREALINATISSPEMQVRGILYTPEIIQSKTTLPLVILIHGNHQICDSIATRSAPPLCPVGDVEARSDLGYEYLAKELVARGFVVLSPNLNRNININMNLRFAWDPLVRANLVVKTLRKMEKWKGIPTASGRNVSLGEIVDFENIGLMGHSRGGEATRYLNAILPRNVPNAKIKGIFEVGSIDASKGSAVNNITGTIEGAPWIGIAGSCDGDVQDLSVASVFERGQNTSSSFRRSLLVVTGANHNYFNSKWLLDDASAILCTAKASRSEQEDILKHYLVAFFDASFKNEDFDVTRNVVLKERLIINTFIPYKNVVLVPLGSLPTERRNDSRLAEWYSETFQKNRVEIEKLAINLAKKFYHNDSVSFNQVVYTQSNRFKMDHILVNLTKSSIAFPLNISWPAKELGFEIGQRFFCSKNCSIANVNCKISPKLLLLNRSIIPLDEFDDLISDHRSQLPFYFDLISVNETVVDLRAGPLYTPLQKLTSKLPVEATHIDSLIIEGEGTVVIGNILSL